MGKAELARHQIEHGDEIHAGSKASCLALNGAEDTVESLHKSIGQSPLPVRKDSPQVLLDHLCDFDHGSKDANRQLGNRGIGATPTCSKQRDQRDMAFLLNLPAGELRIPFL